MKITKALVYDFLVSFNFFISFFFFPAIVKKQPKLQRQAACVLNQDFSADV